jgi:hypothetical protein
MNFMRTRRAFIAIVLLGVALLGCSTNAPGDRYLAIMAPVNAATTSFQHATASIGPDSSPNDLSKAALAFAKAIDQADTKMKAARWPRVIDQDMKNLVSANQALVTDLQRATSQNLSPTQWMSQLHSDETATLRASTIVRSDLGLPTGGS